MSVLCAVFCLAMAQFGCGAEFLSCFEKADFLNEIDVDKQVAICALEETSNVDHITNIYAISTLNDENNVTTLSQVVFNWGVDNSYFLLTSFDKKGNLLAKKMVGYNSLEKEGGTYNNIEVVCDSLIEVEIRDITYDLEYNETLLKKEYQYYLINESGFKQILFHQPGIGRKYSHVSGRILTGDELEKKSRKELDIMRNEIFADHGYIFKSDKWKTYFGKQSWYDAKFDDVNDQLNLIEKINIQTILKVTTNK